MNNEPLTIPTHIAIIMDGNRRWARAHNLPILEGHRRVVNDVMETLVEHAADRGVEYITFWAWSTENWQRDKVEVAGIMKLFRHVIADRWAKLHEKGVRIRTIGDLSQFEPAIKEPLQKIVEQTKNNKRITAVFALNYGGRDEIVRAINKYVHTPPVPSPNLGEGQGEVRGNITEEEFSELLDTKGIPDPELIIRTGGAQRTSGFLLWQSEYSEWYFPTWYMPEFTPEKLDEAIEEFNNRQRRFGR